MNAPFKQPDGGEIHHQPAMVSEVEALMAFNDWLEDRNARRMVIDRYISGWCTAEFALETLIGLGLIEHTPGLLEAPRG